jgi:LPS export ABC transporter permease LptG/LPS export ABC transporter permease LptF
MGILARSAFWQVAVSAAFGTALFTFVLFLQQARDLFGFVVRSSASGETIRYLFALTLPYALTFTLPVGVLVGTLLALTRMSSDNEITGMRVSGIPGRTLAAPVLTFSAGMMLATAAMTCWLNPWSIRETFRVVNQLATEQVTAEIPARVFDESFPKTVLYVGDVIPGKIARWKHVWIGDNTPPGERQGNMTAADNPRITVAAEAVAVPDMANNRVQLQLTNARTFEVGSNGEYNVVVMAQSNQALQAQKPDEQRARPYRSQDMAPLWKAAQTDPEARIEFHQRLALPVACVLLALVGLPLGMASRKGGRSGAVVLTVLLALGYYSALISLIGVAKERRLAVEAAVWLPNAVLLVAGLWFASRLERPGDGDARGWLRTGLTAAWTAVRRRLMPGEARGFSLPAIGLIADNYVLSMFLFYFTVLLSSFVLMTHVFTFFELLGDILRNKIPMGDVIWYHVCLTPKLIYDATPVSVLAATLVSFGVLGKQNELTAFKAAGISLYRLALPVLFTALVMSALLFGFDQTVVPPANRTQDALRNKIKGRPVRSFLNPERNWIRGEGCRMFHYKYLDLAGGKLARVNVYDKDCETYHIKRHIYAESARWEPGLKTWVFQDGWVRRLDRFTREKQDFQGGTASFPDIKEQPSYFVKEVKQEKQMTYAELAQYISELSQGGFDTVRLQVQYYKKFAVPLFAFIMALIAVPFAFGIGNRGAMSGVGVSLGIAVAYWSVNQLFEQVGNLSQLPPAAAAWAPDVVFTLVGAYFVTRIRT